MMLPPDDVDRRGVASYEQPRGACPRCRSGNVRHLVTGMPSGPNAGADPDWVARVGSVHPGYDRECLDCGLSWTGGVGDVVLNTFGDLLALCDATTGYELAEWVTGKIELDAFYDEQLGERIIGIHSCGTSLEFPMTLWVFWDIIRDLEDGAKARLEEDHKEWG